MLVHQVFKIVHKFFMYLLLKGEYEEGSKKYIYLRLCLHTYVRIKVR